MSLKIFTLLFSSALLFACMGYNSESTNNKYVASNDPQKLPEAQFKNGNDTLAMFFQKKMYIPYNAAYFGVNANVDVELSVDTAGRLIYVRALAERIDYGNNSDTNDLYYSLSGLFALEAERLVWLTSKNWIAAESFGEKLVSTQVIKFEFKTKQYQEEKQDKTLAKGIFADPNGDQTPKNFFEIANLLMSYSMYTDASRFLIASTSLFAKNADAWFNLGLCYKALKQKELSCRAFNEASKLGDVESSKVIQEYCNK